MDVLPNNIHKARKHKKYTTEITEEELQVYFLYYV